MAKLSGPEYVTYNRCMTHDYCCVTHPHPYAKELSSKQQLHASGMLPHTAAGRLGCPGCALGHLMLPA